jgi:hypothetical protein
MVQILALNNMTAARIAVIGLRTSSDLFAGAKAMMIESLKEKMSAGVAHFVFVKKNGEAREAWGTLNRSLVVKYINGRGESREIYATSAFFDVEKGQWRSFRWESIVKIF